MWIFSILTNGLSLSFACPGSFVFPISLGGFKMRSPMCTQFSLTIEHFHVVEKRVARDCRPHRVQNAERDFDKGHDDEPTARCCRTSVDPYKHQASKRDDCENGIKPTNPKHIFLRFCDLSLVIKSGFFSVFLPDFIVWNKKGAAPGHHPLSSSREQLALNLYFRHEKCVGHGYRIGWNPGGRTCSDTRPRLAPC